MEIDPTTFFKDLCTFTTNIKSGPSECSRYLETLNRTLIEEQINTSFIDVFLIHLFEKSSGLINFLEIAIKIKDFKNPSIKAVEILYTIVNNFPSKLLERNILDVYTFCNNVIKLHAPSEVKIKILDLLFVSLEKLDICFETNDISTTYKELVNSLLLALKQKHCDTVKHKEMTVLGYFAKRYQYLVIDNHKNLQLLFVRNLEPEIMKPKKSQHIICGFFIGFSYFCESFPLNLQRNEDKKLIEKLYKLMYNLVVPTEKIKIGNRGCFAVASLKLMQYEIVCYRSPKTVNGLFLLYDTGLQGSHYQYTLNGALKTFVVRNGMHRKKTNCLNRLKLVSAGSMHGHFCRNDISISEQARRVKTIDSDALIAAVYSQHPIWNKWEKCWQEIYRAVGVEAALTFLTNNINVFGELLLKDYKYWHMKLLKLLEMGADEKKVAVVTMKAFFQETSSLICNKTDGQWNGVIQHFNQWGLGTLKKESVSNYEKHLAIHCLKLFSKASFMQLPTADITNLLLIIMENFENNYILNCNPKSEEWQYLPDYVQTVANFMQFKTFTTNEFYCLQRAVINMIKSFHQLPYLHYYLVIDGIVITCFYLKETKNFDPFLENMIYQGIVWSCSHQHISNADISDEIDNLITVKHFFPLWTGLLKLASNRTYEKHGLFLEDRKYLLERIVNQFVKTLMVLINKLNLSVKLKEEHVAITELEKAYEVEQSSDHAIFLNVVDLYQELFENIEPKMFKKCIFRFIKHILNKCINYPMLSGFYKLLSCCLKIASNLNIFKEHTSLNQDITNMTETLRQFLVSLLDKMTQYKDELLIACLKVLLESPAVIIKDMLPICVVPFITVFNIGRSYFPLAEMGINTLHHWQDSLPKEEFDPFVSKIISTLDSYLRSKSLLGQTRSNVTEIRRKTAQVLKKRKVVVEIEPELMELQKKILSFIGKQNSNVCHAFVYGENSDEITPSVCGSNHHLKIALPFEDISVEIYLDAFVSRVVNLALYSSDRKTKITACELLQAIIMVFLGRAKPMSQAGLSELEDLLKTVAIPLLQLGCDIDQLVQQIFSPLVFQLIHWYASPTQLRGSHTAIMIDALMEGVTHPTNSCLRDFSGKCLKEFVKWTIKQTSEQYLSTDPVNIKILIKKMRFFSIHADPIKKLGAALIFNNIYREIREEESLINIFWIEILHIFINSLSLIDDNSFENGNTILQINNALSHLERVFIEKSHVFRASNNKRRVPSEINGDTLRDVAFWLLKQTGNISAACRKASMDLFISIAPLTSNKKINLRAFVEEVYETNFVNTVYEGWLNTNKTLKDMSCTEYCSILFKWMQWLCCALDGYNFTIKNNLCDINFGNNIIFNVVGYFLKNLQTTDMAGALKLIAEKTWTFTTIDMDQFNKQKCACVLSILKVFNTIMLNDTLVKQSVSIWNIEFWKLILNILFYPQLLGLDDRVSHPKYLEILTILLNNLPRKISGNDVGVLAEIIHKFVEENYIASIDLKRNVTLLQRNIISALLLLDSTNLNKVINIEKYVNGLIENLIENFIATLDNNVLYLNEFQETTYEYCNLIFKLSLTNTTEMKNLINHLHRPYTVESMEFNKQVKFGIFILNAFGEVIIPILLNKFDIFLNTSLEFEELEITIELVMFILHYIGKKKINDYHHKDVCKELLNKWYVFEPIFNSNLNLGIEYIKLFNVISKSRSMDHAHQWLIYRLVQNEDLNDKLQIFNLLLNVVDSDNLKSRSNLENGLLSLSDKVEADGTSFISDKILNCLPNVNSGTVFKCIIKLYEKLNTSVEIQPLLKQFITQSNIQTQENVLNIIYEITTDTQIVFHDRYKIIKNVIPPLFQACKESCCEGFFEEHINNIVDRLQNADDLETNIVDFVLIEILFLRIPIGTKERNDCSISNAAKNPKLLQLFLKFTLEAFKKQSTGSTETLRLFKCHAYNALASIISNSLKAPSFYEKLFIRSENGKDILWSGIIDITTNFTFPIFFDSIPSQRKVVINIRDELRAQHGEHEQKTKSFKYIESQKLFSSSLSEDITNYDFTNTTLRSQTHAHESAASALSCQSEIQLDAVDINNHECMATICGLVKHIFDIGLEELPKKEEEEVPLPNFMKSIRTTLLDKETPKNIKLFLVKVIDNMSQIFSYYSRWFLEPLLQFVVDKCAGDTLNYFVADVVCIIAKWSSNTLTLNEKERKLATEMLYFLIINLNNERTDVFKYNLDLIKLIVESWKNFIEVPTVKLFEILSSDSKCEIGIHLASIFLVNDLKPWQENKSEAFIMILLKKINSSKKSTYKSCAETIGLMLKYSKGMYNEKVDKQLKAITDFNKYVYCLEGVAIHFPQLVTAYHVSKLISSLNQFPDTQKIIHLKIILRRVQISLDILEEINDFKIVEWSDFLESSNLEIQIITLKIIKACLSMFMTYKTYPDIIKTLGRNVTHTNALYRNCVYDTAISVYKENKDISDTCKEILISGLVDEDSENKMKVISFWRENPDLPKEVINRFPYLLSNLYKAKLEEYFLGYINYFLIMILNTYEEYNSEIFEHPLEDCDFEDYRLQLNWRLQHPSVVPLFAETFMDEQSIELSDNSNIFQLRETQANLSFAPTQSVREQEFSKYTNLESSLSVNISDGENLIKNPNDMILSQKYRLPKRRFLKDKSKISIISAHHEAKKQIKKVEKRRDLAKEREKKVTIYRSYRKGDFPDIQICLSAILQPLQMLSLHDGEISKILIMEIFKGIVSKADNSDLFMQSVLDSIQHIFHNSINYNPNLISTLLDILLKHKDKFRCDEPQLISYVCQQSGLLSIGSLLLEEYLISLDDIPSTSKKGTGSVENKETVYWVKLAELYKELEGWDMVRSIFLEKMNCKDIIQKAIQFESEAQWRTAQELYAELIETDVSADRKDFYYDSYFKCFANLGEWEELPNAIKSVITSSETDDVWTILWDKDCCQQKLLPWYIQAHVKNILFSNKWSEEFSSNLNECLSNADKAEYLQTNFSEELCILWLFKKDIASSNVYLNSYIKNFLSNWQLLNPMYESLRYDKILRLRNVIEVNEFISIYKNVSDDFEEPLREFTAKWQNTSNEILPSILLNETRVLYRTLYMNLLEEKILKLDASQNLETLQSIKTNLDSSLIDVATELNNHYISRKYLKRHRVQKNFKFQLACGNILFLKANTNTDPQEKLKVFIQAVDVFESLFNVTNNPETLLQTNMKYFDITTKIALVLANHETLFPQFQKILGTKFRTEINGPEDIITYASHKLRHAVESLGGESMDCDNNDTMTKIKSVASAFVKLAYFTRERKDENLQGDFILYVLRAMKLNSPEAKQLFPCILIQNRLGNDFVQLFIDETENIPTWMFLGWIPQLLANLDTKKITAISKIIIRIAETYPQAIMYPYRLSKEHYKVTDCEVADEAQDLINKLDNLLLNNVMIDTFLKALSFVSVPLVILKYYISKMYKSSKEDEIKANQEKIISNIFEEIPNSKDTNSLQGNMFKCISKFKKKIENTLKAKKVKEGLQKIDEELTNALKNDKTSVLLKDYCPWLANFSANKLNLDLEIPGQYTGEKLPLPQHHIKISGFLPNVSVMTSLRKPIKLTIIGMDTKEYPFLVKFGEDIRQDQRIEQLFGLMNDIFRSDTTCSSTNLQILTYQVIPLTSNLGMIQWVNDTQPLNDFLKKSLNKKEINDFNKISNDYSNWLCSGKTAAICYGSSAVKYNRNKTIAFYRSLVHRVPWDILRKSFWTLSSTTENYIALRNNFIKTYAVLCISHWILGIGDRHLNNSLICIRNGKVLGIDFGHAFGTATQILPVPELVPFRLTPHITNLMEPLKERGQFRHCMIHSLRALRANNNSLLATMNVFVEEPSLDWLEHAFKFETETEETHNWYPTVKINQTKRKLEGDSSTKILIEDLVAGRKNPTYIEAYVSLVKGLPEYDTRAQSPNNNLSVEDQVDCLLDHATDDNLLGRMWVGWMPWV